MNIGDIEDRFDRVAPDYERHAALEFEVGDRLIERTAFVRYEPRMIVDLGCGTGRASRQLKSRFAGAEIVRLDLSSEMLRQGVITAGETGRGLELQADLTRIPLVARSVDLVISNLALQWATDFEQAVMEVRRVLRPGGMFLFTVPGPESLRELHGRVSHGGSMSIPIYMPDLQDVGDLLVTAGFSEPVMDSEHITLRYPGIGQMVAELAVTGGAGFADLPVEGQRDEEINVSFEIVYGLAFGSPEGQPVRTPQGEVATFSIDEIRRQSKE